MKNVVNRLAKTGFASVLAAIVLSLLGFALFVTTSVPNVTDRLLLVIIVVVGLGLSFMAIQAYRSWREESGIESEIVLLEELGARVFALLRLLAVLGFTLVFYGGLYFVYSILFQGVEFIFADSIERYPNLGLFLVVFHDAFRFFIITIGALHIIISLLELFMELRRQP